MENKISNNQIIPDIEQTVEQEKTVDFVTFSEDQRTAFRLTPQTVSQYIKHFHRKLASFCIYNAALDALSSSKKTQTIWNDKWLIRDEGDLILGTNCNFVSENIGTPAGFHQMLVEKILPDINLKRWDLVGVQGFYINQIRQIIEEHNQTLNSPDSFYLTVL